MRYLTEGLQSSITGKNLGQTASQDASSGEASIKFAQDWSRPQYASNESYVKQWASPTNESYVKHWASPTNESYVKHWASPTIAPAGTMTQWVCGPPLPLSRALT